MQTCIIMYKVDKTDVFFENLSLLELSGFLFPPEVLMLALSLLRSSSKFTKQISKKDTDGPTNR